MPSEARAFPADRNRFACPSHGCALRFPTFQELAEHAGGQTTPQHRIKNLQCPACDQWMPIHALVYHLKAPSAPELHARFTRQVRDLELYLYQYLTRAYRLMLGTSNGQPVSSSHSPSNTTNVHPPIVPSQAEPAQVPSPAPSEEIQEVAATVRRTPSGSTSATTQAALVARKRSAAVAFQGGQTNQMPNTGNGSPSNGLPFDWARLLAHYTTNFNIFVQQIGQLLPTEEFRLATLKEAVQYQDHGFLVFHQVLCLYSYEPSKLSQVTQLNKSCRQGMVEVDHLMNPEDAIRSRFFQFWSRFPADIRTLAAQEEKYKALLPPTMIALEHFARNFDRLKEICKRRQYPPSAGELASDLQVTSAVLQRVVFHSISQTAWPACPRPLLAQALYIFQTEDQTHWGNLCGEDRRHEYTDRYMPARWETFRNMFNRENAENARRTSMQQQILPNVVNASPQSALQSGMTASPNVQTWRAQGNTAHAPTASNTNTTFHREQAQPLIQTFPLVAHNQQRTSVSSTASPRTAAPGRSSSLSGHPMNPSGQSSPVPARQTSLTRRPGQLLYPRHGVGGAQVAPPHPDKYALHLAHLRSPRLIAVDTQVKMFQQVSGLALAPTEVNTGEALHDSTFDLSDEQFWNLARDVANEDDPSNRCLRQMKPNSVTYRLRCVEGALPEDMSEWALRDTIWPPDVHFKLNGYRLHPRCKVHFGRYLPIDVTRALKAGTNTLEAFALVGHSQKVIKTLSIAIERVTLLSHSDIVNAVLANTIPASEIIDSIRDTLNPSTADGASDDLQCLDSTVSIDLMDPIMAISMWKTPVRAKSCKHREAFDLETFLLTRRDVKAADNVPSTPDKWVCPKCGADARPSELLVDGFLVGLRSDLEEKRLLDTARVVDVDEQGVWNVREERRAARSMSRAESGAPVGVDGARDTPQRAAREVVDLSD